MVCDAVTGGASRRMHWVMWRSGWGDNLRARRAARGSRGRAASVARRGRIAWSGKKRFAQFAGVS
eukprot:6230407-Pyramimonas_sp.AAC.1